MTRKEENRDNAFLKGIISRLPDLPGIYQYFDKEGSVIYIGKAKSLKKRVSSYFTKTPENRKTALLVRNIADIRHMVVDYEEDALLLENNLIKKYKPRYNIRLKDDKTYPWICIKKERFPRVFKTRHVVRDGSEYFGPFTSWMTVTTLLELFKKLYKLRTCNYVLSEENVNKGKYKRCLEFHIGNCNGPCEGLIEEIEYNHRIDEIRDILKGNVGGVIRQLKALMVRLSQSYQFEHAQMVKERISSLEKYRSKSTVVSTAITDVDVFTIDSDEKIAVVNYLKVIQGAIVQTYSMEIRKQLDESDQELLLVGIVEIRLKIFSNAKEILIPFRLNSKLNNLKFTVPQRGDKYKLVELSHRNAKYFRLEKMKQAEVAKPLNHTERILATLQKDFQLVEVPARIECFDNSNLQGTSPVAACVVFINGKPAKREYRHYNIKTVEGPDDFASMFEIVTRRYKRQLDEQQPLPQLIIVDGGKGQLSAAVQALENLGLRGKIPVVGIAKRLEEIYFPNDPVPVYLDKKSESLKLIQRLRDEAHRFGITFHRLKRSSDFITSELGNIPGIGKATSQKLLSRFKSVKNISIQPIETLEQEIGSSRARKVYDYFHSLSNTENMTK